jgi:Winged helix DNA-binding domain
MTLTWEQVRARRLARSHLARRAGRAVLVEVVREVGGLQAQILTAAEVGVGIRVSRITQADVRRALWEERTLVKTWSLRNTLHLVPADEVTMWTAARRAVDDAWYTPWELDAKQAGRLLQAFRDVLDGRALERQELADEVAARVGTRLRERLLSQWGDLVSLGIYGDAVCFGANRGAKVTFVRADQWLERHEPRDAHESLLQVCTRYVAAYGPALPKSFAEWFGNGLKPARAKQLFAELDLEPIDVEGKTMWVLPGDTRASRASSVRLVPQYDAYVMGFRERGVLVPPRVRELVATRPRGRYEGPAGLRFLLIDGVTAGFWDRAKRGKRVEVQVAPVRAIARRERDELQAEVARLGAFLGLEPVLTVA